MSTPRVHLYTRFFQLSVPTQDHASFVPPEGFQGFFEVRLRPMFGIIQAVLPCKVYEIPYVSANPIGEYSVTRQLMAIFLDNVVRSFLFSERQHMS